LIGQTPNAAKFRYAPTKSARYPLWKNFAPWKSRPKFTLVTRFVTNRQAVHEFL